MKHSENDDPWSALDRELIDAARARAVRVSLDEPAGVAAAFLSALKWADIEALEQLTNPDCRSRWGDYSEAVALLNSIPSWGMGTVPIFAVGREDVAYIKVLSSVPSSFRFGDDDEILMIACVVSLVHRPEMHGQWFVQAIGDYWRPEPLERAS